MNCYPTWWNTTLTIFNKYQDTVTGITTWYKHIIENCFWKYTGSKVAVGETVLETNDIICRIPKRDEFKENYQWINVPADEKPNFFTVNKGDIIVRGEITDSIDEYTSGSRSSDLIKKYKALQGCMVVGEFTINIDGGRFNEHYYIKGE